MGAKEVGKKLVALCREGKFDDAMKSLYDKNIVSIEAAAPPGGSRETKGLDGCLEKGKHFNDTNEVHKAVVEGPFPTGDDDKFAVYYDFDVTRKPGGEKMKLQEVGLYTVKGDKIVHEEFLYSM